MGVTMTHSHSNFPHSAYSGDRDQSFRSIVTGCAASKSCAAQIVLRHLRRAAQLPCIWLFGSPKGVLKVWGWGPRAKPVGAGQDAAPGKRSASGRRRTAGERWVTDAPAGTAGCPQACPVGRSVIHGGRESPTGPSTPCARTCCAQADFKGAASLPAVVDFEFGRNDSPVKLKR